MSSNTSRFRILVFFLFFAIVSFYSCSKDAALAITPETEGSCTDPLEFVFNEQNGLVVVEFENAKFSSDWKLKDDGNNHTGAGYMVWEGEQQLGNPGHGRVTFKIKITNAGSYQFNWSSAIKMGNSGTDHNDTWLRFEDADDFYAKNADGNSIVYPKDTGKSPNPAGATKDGWFKIYRSGNDLDFKWEASTFDHNGHNIFIDFATPGMYVMEVSARSSGHGIDKFVLFKDSVSKADAIGSTVESVISCAE